ncbi:hypothetical protein KUL42_38770 [Alteromonas sp. KUL42]|uniref:hypothetical protein n=1 Tax=Alteromonas sp. KUL42 TaxID=2480797 RepID=UPI00103579FB|nr:hypothetical protein [Alteromonas sp. KUL42]TAP31684.1 hypothetical protein EYR97_19540 [Alteromonas sp. KUL42]GEA09116.1 hypothetical protein KUL42_38770 [Alteromonas sp. KUL42]
MDNNEVIDVEPQSDEPQFTVPEDSQSEKRKAWPVVLFIIFALTLLSGLIYFIFSGSLDNLLTKETNVPASSKTHYFVEETAMPSSEILNVDYTIEGESGSSVDDEFTTEDVIVDVGTVGEQSTTVEEANLNEGQPVSTVSINSATLRSILSQISELKGAVYSLSSDVQVVRGELKVVHRALGQQNLDGMSQVRALDNKVDNITNLLDASGKKIQTIIHGVDGFRVETERKLQAFTFKVTHSEYYAGKHRLLGYDRSMPNTLLKLYEGNEVGLWKLLSINENEAVFMHKDGSKHVEKF